MRTKVRPASPEAILTRILEALEQELIDASDAEIMEAAQALGMNPNMRGSAAFAGLKYFAKPQLADFFEFEICKNVHNEIERSADPTHERLERDAPQPGRLRNSRDRKESGDK